MPITQKPKRQKNEKKKTAIPIPDQDEVELSKEDVEAVLEYQNYSTFLDSIDADAIAERPTRKEKRKRKDEEEDDNLEEYEKIGRVNKDWKVEEVKRLPIRTEKGIELVEEHSDDEEITNSETVDSQDNIETQLESENNLSEVDEQNPQSQEIQDMESIAKCARQLTSNPAEHLDKFQILLDLSRSESRKTLKLAVLSLLALYKDILPGYFIRKLSEKELSQKVGKEVRQQREFEEVLVKCYGSFVHMLGELFQAEDKRKQLAVYCLCEILDCLHHFNHIEQAIQILVRSLCSNQVGEQAAEGITHFFSLPLNHASLRATLILVQAVAQTIKKRKYNVNPLVVNVFLDLKLGGFLPSQLEKRRRVGYISKKQRQQEKKDVELFKEMKEAEAVMNEEEKHKAENEILKNVVMVYFRIIKDGKKELLMAGLEGVKKFVYLVNMDFFGSVVDKLKGLVQKEIDGDLKIRCIATLFEIASAHAAKYPLDLAYLDEALMNVLDSPCPELYTTLRKVLFKEKRPSTLRMIRWMSALMKSCLLNEKDAGIEYMRLVLEVAKNYPSVLELKTRQYNLTAQLLQVKSVPHISAFSQKLLQHIEALEE